MPAENSLMTLDAFHWPDSDEAKLASLISRHKTSAVVCVEGLCTNACGSQLPIQKQKKRLA